MNRRDTLKALGLLAAGSAAVLANNSCDSKGNKTPALTDAADKMPGIQEFEYERTKQLYEETYFNEHEMATITVLADIIIPKDDKSPAASEVGVPEFIEFIVKDIPDHKLPMRGGLKWLDVYSLNNFKNVFINLKPEEQIAIVDEIAYPSKAKPEMAQGVNFFNRMRDLTASGFYTSKEGIADLGYVGNRPGVWTGVPPDILKEHGFLS
ncbi:gluconate 2-dehydrogenase subunit 3 family protein [Sphingobacterium rhinopitheci]|uniref:gluconate 2-dehydrogenase subunit 3 family protein n=1 Tax=Sphingobacterium rhinopitheci TaxID=2781960 RepID=UPI001F5192E0|nr:gluconate 2-dehydrogenase subunit 3 family protein [Sphingobacterium rhinopitheci]MCI0921901.1 gluconate 2-dehydrogenase subunit 3 family protein [Sphingobacterium rhinopitheci]